MRVIVLEGMGWQLRCFKVSKDPAENYGGSRTERAAFIGVREDEFPPQFNKGNISKDSQASEAAKRGLSNQTDKAADPELRGDGATPSQPDSRIVTAQFHRIKRDAILSEGIAIIATPSPGGAQKTVCLPLALIPGFLFGIDDRRIKDEAIRAKVLRYKRELSPLHHGLTFKLTRADAERGTRPNGRFTVRVGRLRRPACDT